MKHFDETSQKADSEIVSEITKHFKYVGREKAKPGQILFEFSADTDLITVAKIETDKGVVGINNEVQKAGRRVYMKPNCTYFWALNMQNAEKKIKKAKDEFKRHAEAQAQANKFNNSPTEEVGDLPFADGGPSGEDSEEPGSGSLG